MRCHVLIRIFKHNSFHSIRCSHTPSACSEWPRGILIDILIVLLYYGADNQGEYVPESGAQNCSIQGLSDAVTSLESEVTMVQPLAKEYALLLEVTMAD